jgi:HK97 family phage major capsid protein
MINADKRNKIIDAIAEATREGNEDAYKDGLTSLYEDIQDQILNQAAELKGESESTILASRGVRQLTKKEVEFYDRFIEVAKTESRPVDALTNIEKTFPETIISAVMDDMVGTHPLLGAVDTMNVTGLTRLLLNTDTGAAAAWGALNSAITQEISSGFEEIDLTQGKLSAFMPISQDMLALGPVWLDSYIRTCLSEAWATGLENAIVSGIGINGQPIGMIKSIASGVTVSTETGYPDKTATSVTDFGAATFGNLASKLAKTRMGKDRAVSGLILVTNPADYYKLVMPATTVLTPNGTYVSNVLPMPVTIVQSSGIASGKAVLGIGANYFLGVGGNRGIQFSDDYKFLEDQRYYKVVSYATGRAKSDTDFLYLDISAVAPAYVPIKQIS